LLQLIAQEVDILFFSNFFKDGKMIEWEEK